jgi:hexulose-6-phosphate isomerase
MVPDSITQGGYTVKKSINYWSFPGGLEGQKNIADTFAEAKAAGFEAVELCCGESGKLSLKTTERQCMEIRNRAERAGVEIASLASGIYWSYNLGCNTVADRNRAEQATKKMLQIAQWLGTNALLFIPGAVDVFFNPAAEVIPYDVVASRVKEGTQRLVRTAEQCQVALCVENVWSKFLLSPLEMRDFIDGFGSEYVGAYFDVGNVLLYGYPEQWIRILGKRIKRVHLKDFKAGVGTFHGFCDLLEGDVNWPEVVRALKAVGYDGYCTAEMIPLYRTNPMVRIKNTSAAMDAILKA